MWSDMNWSVMSVVCYERICYEQVCFEREPITTYIFCVKPRWSA